MSDRMTADSPLHPARAEQYCRAAVLGDPIEHSQSPTLHNAGYQAAGLSAWEYHRISSPAGELAGIVADLGPEYSGVSVTMPGKFEALRFADVRTARAELIGSANTLYRTTASSWAADNTDGDGVLGALSTIGIQPGSVDHAIICGGGGTARAVVWALGELGVTELTVLARSQRGEALFDLARTCGMQPQLCYLEGTDLRALADSAQLLVNTIPAGGLDPYVADLAMVPRVLDVIYDPWPTALAAAVMARGGQVASGLSMLAYQAFAQFELFCGQPAPRAAMAAAVGLALPSEE